MQIFDTLIVHAWPGAGEHYFIAIRAAFPPFKNLDVSEGLTLPTSHSLVNRFTMFACVHRLDFVQDITLLDQD